MREKLEFVLSKLVAINLASWSGTNKFFGWEEI